MATGVVRLSDTITPEVYFDYLSLDTTRQAKLFKSGIIRMDPLMASRLSAAGVTFQTPFWGDLDDDGSRIGSDDPARVTVPSKIGTGKHQFVRHVRTKSWSTADLVQYLTGADPMKRVSEGTGRWWAREMDQIGFATIKGFLADNAANDGGDMIHDATAEVGNFTINGESVPKSALSARVLLDGKNQLGELAEETLSKLMVHPDIWTALQKQQLIVYKEPAGANIKIPTYLDYELIVSKNMPVEVSGSDLIYTSFLSGADILGYGEAPVDIPVEVERKPSQGNGMGVEILHTRRQFALTPYWFSFTNHTVSDEFPTTEDIALAANWDRKATEREHIPFVAVKTKNG